MARAEQPGKGDGDQTRPSDQQQDQKQGKKEKEQKHKDVKQKAAPPKAHRRPTASSLPTIVELEDIPFMDPEGHLLEQTSKLWQTCRMPTKTEDDICTLFALGHRANSAAEYQSIVNFALDKNYHTLASLLFESPFAAKSKSSRPSNPAGQSSSSSSITSSASQEYDENASKALMEALAGNQYSQQIKELLERKANPDYKSVDGEIPITLAARCVTGKVMTLLIENKANVGGTNALDDTALIVAAKHDNTAALGVLLDVKLSKVGDIKFAHRNRAGVNAYQAALRTDHEECLTRLYVYNKAQRLKMDLNPDLEVLLQENALSYFMANYLLQTLLKWDLTPPVVEQLTDIVQAERRSTVSRGTVRFHLNPDAPPSGSALMQAIQDNRTTKALALFAEGKRAKDQQEYGSMVQLAFSKPGFEDLGALLLAEPFQQTSTPTPVVSNSGSATMSSGLSSSTTGSHWGSSSSPVLLRPPSPPASPTIQPLTSDSSLVTDVAGSSSTHSSSVSSLLLRRGSNDEH